MARKYPTLMVTCYDPKLKANKLIPLGDCVLAIEEGKEIKVSDLLAFYYDLKEEHNTLVVAHNELSTKYNALLAAYKANVTKTAMQLLDLEENK